jgi:hypothetical protein
MDNKTSRKIKLLIGAILLIVISLGALDFVLVGGKEVKRGFKAGWEEARETTFVGKHHLWAKIENIDPDTDTKKLSEKVEFTEIYASGEFEIESDASSNSTVSFILSFVVTAALIAFIVNFIIFACKFPGRKVLSRGNIVRLRWIAASLGALGLAGYGLMLHEYLWLTNITLEGYYVTFPSPPSALVVALILLAMAEIMNLAGRLQNEQDLTI